jgi:tRNA modification GTPase
MGVHQVVIVGRPNVGKSSIFNCLLNEDRAIVTPIPGTTRDLVAESANIGGIPLRFVDTAGVREALDEVERIGVERTLRAIADSDLRLLVLDASEPWTDEDAGLIRKLRPLGALLLACNKSDLPQRLTANVLGDLLVAAGVTEGPRMEAVWTSALTGEGIPELREKILAAAVPAQDIAPEGEFITNLRHQQLIKVSLEGLAKARQAAGRRIHHEMLLIDLYDALRPLDQITGATYVDDVLDIIFKSFCVGK